MNDIQHPLAYTDTEVSFMLKVSRRTIYRLRKSGRLAEVRIGRSVRVSRESLQRFLAESTVAK